jgi:hypothetical protein
VPFAAEFINDNNRSEMLRKGNSIMFITTTAQETHITELLTLAEVIADLARINVSMAAVDPALLQLPLPATLEGKIARFVPLYGQLRPMFEVAIGRAPAEWRPKLAALIALGDGISVDVNPDFKAGKDV